MEHSDGDEERGLVARAVRYPKRGQQSLPKRAHPQETAALSERRIFSTPQSHRQSHNERLFRSSTNRIGVIAPTLIG